MFIANVAYCADVFHTSQNYKQFRESETSERNPENLFLCRVLNVKEKTCAAIDKVLVSHWPAAVHCHSVSIKI